MLWLNCYLFLTAFGPYLIQLTENNMNNKIQELTLHRRQNCPDYNICEQKIMIHYYGHPENIDSNGVFTVKFKSI